MRRSLVGRRALPVAVRLDLFESPIDPRRHRALGVRAFGEARVSDLLVQRAAFAAVAPRAGAALKVLTCFLLMTTEVDNSIDAMRTTVVPRVIRDECSIGAFVRRTVTYCLSSRDCNCNEALATKRHH